MENKFVARIELKDNILDGLLHKLDMHQRCVYCRRGAKQDNEVCPNAPIPPILLKILEILERVEKNTNPHIGSTE
jgi:hypothetical protein